LLPKVTKVIIYGAWSFLEGRNGYPKNIGC